MPVMPDATRQGEAALTDPEADVPNDRAAEARLQLRRISRFEICSNW